MNDTGQPRPDDPGEDVEALGGGTEVARTDLAWSRSGLALVVSAAAILKVIVDIGDYRAPIVILIVLVAGTIAWALAIVHSRFVSAPALEGRLLADQRKLRFVSWVTCAFALSALVVACLPNV
jgi:hypothetical protein